MQDIQVIPNLEDLEPEEVNRLFLDEALKAISKVPPMDIDDNRFWEVWERVPNDIKIAVIGHWKWMGRYLDAYFHKESDPLPNSDQTELEQATIRVYGQYYLALYNVLFNAERFIKSEAKRQGIHYPFKCVGDLFYALVFEDFLSSLEPCLSDHWESLPASVELECLRFSSQFWKGDKTNAQTASRLEKQIKKAEKLQPLCGRWNRWNFFFREVAARNRHQLQPSLRGFGDAQADIYRFWTSRKSPGCDRLKKILFVNGAFVQSPIGKNRRKSLT
jgi:hypothetical protein